MFTQIKTIHLFLIFVLVAVIQLSIPAKMIYQQEDVLNSGILYKFKTQPIDPADPFRGKYIRLDFEASRYQTKDTTWVNDEIIYVSLTTDENGYAKINDVTRSVPSNTDYIEAKVDWYTKWQNELRIAYNIERFYMKETKAMAAEIAHMEAQSDAIPHLTYATIYVKNGTAVLEDVFIDDVSIADFVEE
jgi:uncharacterized membrane-anchored protein